jgi:Zn-finger nucleic acid-binding protein
MMKCPNCDTTLAMSERLGVEIDYCPQCRGVWLDRDEIDRLLEAERSQAPAVAAVPAATAPAPPSPAYAPPAPYPYDDRRAHEPGSRRRKKWSDLLDFD